MFSFFKNVKMPAPPEEMLKTHLKYFGTSIDSEIISGTYEPRFKLYALGTSSGYLYVINEKHIAFRSPKSVNYPLLKIISLPNSSSFFSICSKSMFEKHPSRCEKPNPHNLQQLNSIKSSKIQNICTHWIIQPDRILSRTVPLEYDIVDFALSPIHPEFALFLTKEGSLFGFSIESLNFTNLYINIFENKPVRSICWSSGYRFLVGHDIIEGFDVQKLEIGSQYNVKAEMMDSIDHFTAVIDQSGTPKLLMYTNPVSSIDVQKDSKAVFVSMLNGSNWMAVIRSKSGDQIYENKNPKIQLKGEFVIPDLLVNYDKPFERSNPKEVAFSTDYGRFLFLNGKVVDNFFFDIPDVEFAFADLDDVFVFAIDKDAKIVVDQKNKKVSKKKSKKKLKCETKNEDSKNKTKDEKSEKKDEKSEKKDEKDEKKDGKSEKKDEKDDKKEEKDEKKEEEEAQNKDAESKEKDEESKAKVEPENKDEDNKNKEESKDKEEDNKEEQKEKEDNEAKSKEEPSKEAEKKDEDSKNKEKSPKDEDSKSKQKSSDSKKEDDDDDDDDSESEEEEVEDPIGFTVFRFRHGALHDRFTLNSLQVTKNPLGISHDKVLFVENRNDVCVFDLKKKAKTVLRTLDNIVNVRHTKRRFPDFVLEDGSVLKCKATDDGFELFEADQKCPSTNIVDWRLFKDSMVYITQESRLVFKESTKKIIKSDDERIIAFEVVNYLGRTPKEGDEEYIIVVTSSRVLVLDFDSNEKKMRKIRKVKYSPIRNASFSKIGTLILHTESEILMLPLPDISSATIDKIPISKDGKAALVHKLGAILFDTNSVSLFLDGLEAPKIYDTEAPVIETPKVNKFLKLFGKKDDSVKDADDAFQYSRSSNVMARISETQEVMQQLLVKANERGELLNEMEIKSNKLLTTAQKFHQMAKDLKNRPWFL